MAADHLPDPVGFAVAGAPYVAHYLWVWPDGSTDRETRPVVGWALREYAGKTHQIDAMVQSDRGSSALTDAPDYAGDSGALIGVYPEGEEPTEDDVRVATGVIARSRNTGAGDR
jgi:hypothetical protein